MYPSLLKGKARVISNMFKNEFMLNCGLVSIITPSWNCETFLDETIRSVQSQTYQNWELLFQDDCSTDNTKDIIAKYAEKDSRIKYEINNKNSGAAITRNNALKRAKGKWIAFLDSDDLWEPEKLEKQIHFMSDNGYHFSYTECIFIDEYSNPLGVHVSGPHKVGKFHMYNYCWIGCLTVMYDREYIGLVQIEDIKKNNDYAMWLKVSQYADCYLLPEVLASYRVRQNSISRHPKIALIKWHYKLFRDAEKQNVIMSVINTIRNLIFGVYKKLRYNKRYTVNNNKTK